MFKLWKFFKYEILYPLPSLKGEDIFPIEFLVVISSDSIKSKFIDRYSKIRILIFDNRKLLKSFKTNINNIVKYEKFSKNLMYSILILDIRGQFAENIMVFP